MSPICCPGCGADIPDESPTCVQCGRPVKRPRGVDKGFCLSYFKLSYRRKAVRTIWFTPVLLVIYYASLPFFVICGLILLVQLVYNLVMWRKLER